MESHLLNLSCSSPPMVETAILNAEFHGINLHHGVPNLANGDCAIEAIADNISTRPEFKEVYNGGSEYNRRVWMSEAENLVFHFSGTYSLWVRTTSSQNCMGKFLLTADNSRYLWNFLLLNTLSRYAILNILV